MPAKPFTPTLDKNGKPNAVLEALSRGYVVAAPGSRGRTLKDASGKFSGKAPAAVVDLKAAVRYLKFNDAAMSALLGVSAGASDKIYAVSAYCPVINLENADAAYEWIFGAQNRYEKLDFSGFDAGEGLTTEAAN